MYVCEGEFLRDPREAAMFASVERREVVKFMRVFAEGSYSGGSEGQVCSFSEARQGR